MIELFGATNSSEGRAAKNLIELFKYSFPDLEKNEDLNLKVYSGAKFHGYQIKDIDCILICQFKSPQRFNPVREVKTKPNEEIEKKLWKNYLNLFNLIQFLPDSICVTQKGILSDMYEPIVWSSEEVLDDSEELFESEFTAVLNEVSDFLTEGLLALNNIGVEVPVVGYEIMNKKNEVIGEVELAWEALKIAGVLDGQKDVLSEVDDSWLVLDLDQGDDWVQEVKNRFEGEGR